MRTITQSRDVPFPGSFHPALSQTHISDPHPTAGMLEPWASLGLGNPSPNVGGVRV